ncbi:hypothetical protein M8818_003006 [Zalaria obscura]|uniref:Uncharacterized protein n=1 Tax=Zalaria obscura TaxID=2024903 RepID=A0ACC3SIS9_9PEZI
MWTGWLISKDRPDEALKILARYHANDNIHDEVIQFEFAEVRASMQQEKDNSKGRYVDLINTPGNRKRLFICVCCGLFSQLSGTGLTGYYLRPKVPEPSQWYHRHYELDRSVGIRLAGRSYRTSSSISGLQHRNGVYIRNLDCVDRCPEQHRRNWVGQRSHLHDFLPQLHVQPLLGVAEPGISDRDLAISYQSQRRYDTKSGNQSGLVLRTICEPHRH